MSWDESMVISKEINPEAIGVMLACRDEAIMPA